jgi:hypothetical protein
MTVSFTETGLFQQRNKQYGQTYLTVNNQIFVRRANIVEEDYSCNETCVQVKIARWHSREDLSRKLIKYWQSLALLNYCRKKKTTTDLCVAC